MQHGCLPFTGRWTKMDSPYSFSPSSVSTSSSSAPSSDCLTMVPEIQQSSEATRFNKLQNRAPLMSHMKRMLHIMSWILDCEDTPDPGIQCCKESSCGTDERHAVTQKATIKDIHTKMQHIYRKLVAWDCDWNTKLCRCADIVGRDFGLHMKEYNGHVTKELVAWTCLIELQTEEWLQWYGTLHLCRGWLLPVDTDAC